MFFCTFLVFVILGKVLKGVSHPFKVLRLLRLRLAMTFLTFVITRRHVVCRRSNLGFDVLGGVLRRGSSHPQLSEIASPSARNDLLGDSDCLFTRLRSFFHNDLLGDGNCVPSLERTKKAQ